MAPSTVKIVLVGNKSDMDESNHRVVSQEEGEALAKEHDVRFIECSAVSGKNIQLIFETLGTSIIGSIENQQNISGAGNLTRPPELRSSKRAFRLL